jgi:hypothetical protein
VSPGACSVKCSAGPARGTAAIELLELVRHRRAHEDLRIRRRREGARLLALDDLPPRGLERGQQRIGVREPVLEQGFAEERRRAAVAATERRTIRIRRGENERVVVPQCFDEAAGIARGDHDDAPFDAGAVEESPEGGRSERRQFERRQRDFEHMPAAAVARQVDHHDVLLGVDGRADLVQRLAQVVTLATGASAASAGC